MTMDPAPIADARLGIRHVFVRDLVLPAHIGVRAAEQGRAQRVRINADLGVEDDGARPLSRRRVGPDDLARVVDYSVIVARVRQIVAAGHVRLVETLAERIAEACLEDARVFSARIRVEKLDIYPDAGGVGVEIERRRA
jgi:7,8-dihydroneopterin aldolase/epimerase/oxygenase